MRHAGVRGYDNNRLSIISILVNGNYQPCTPTWGAGKHSDLIRDAYGNSPCQAACFWQENESIRGKGLKDDYLYESSSFNYMAIEDKGGEKGSTILVVERGIGTWVRSTTEFGCIISSADSERFRHQ